jgi:hypothetical protein
LLEELQGTGESMTRITQAAGRHLDKQLDAAQAEEGTAVRIDRYANLWTMRLDREAPGDTAFDYRGRTVLLMDPSVAEELAETTVDICPTPSGARFVLF